MILNCSKCGAPYTGGFICERCGNRFDEADIKEYQNEQKKREEYAAFAEETRRKNEKNSANIAVIVIASFVGLIVLSIIGAIFIPAFIGYNAKKKAFEEQRKARENSSYYEEYDYSYDD